MIHFIDQNCVEIMTILVPIVIIKTNDIINCIISYSCKSLCIHIIH